MKIKFWGVRGSYPAARQDVIGYGGNTTCLEVTSEREDHHIVDAGSGIISLGQDLMKRHQGKPFDAKLYFTHMHWDHIHGFPFFTPAFIPGVDLTVYGTKRKSKFDSALAGDETFEKLARRAERKGELTKYLLELQQSKYVFPVKIDTMRAKPTFVDLQDEEVVKNGLTASFRRYEFAHPTGVTSYKFADRDGKTLVVQADFEHNAILPEALRGATIAESEETAKQLESVLEWWKDADMVYYDSQYLPEEYDPAACGKQGMCKKTWGHSTYEKGIDLALQAGIKHLVLGHHEPMHSDEMLNVLFQRAKTYLDQKAAGRKLTLSMAREGLEYVL